MGLSGSKEERILVDNNPEPLDITMTEAAVEHLFNSHEFNRLRNEQELPTPPPTPTEPFVAEKEIPVIKMEISPSTENIVWTRESETLNPLPTPTEISIQLPTKDISTPPAVELFVLNPESVEKDPTIKKPELLDPASENLVIENVENSSEPVISTSLSMEPVETKEIKVSVEELAVLTQDTQEPKQQASEVLIQESAKIEEQQKELTLSNPGSETSAQKQKDLLHEKTLLPEPIVEEPAEPVKGPVEIPVVPAEGQVVQEGEPEVSILSVEEPVVPAEKTEVTVEEPVVTVEESVVIVEEPVVTEEVPEVSVEEPVATVEEPVATVQEPVTPVSSKDVSIPHTPPPPPQEIVLNLSSELNQKRIQNYEQAMVKSFNDGTKEINDLVRDRYKTTPICNDLQRMLTGCYKENTRYSMKCADLAEKYSKCVEEQRKARFEPSNSRKSSSS